MNSYNISMNKKMNSYNISMDDKITAIVIGNTVVISSNGLPGNMPYASIIAGEEIIEYVICFYVYKSVNDEYVLKLQCIGTKGMVGFCPEIINVNDGDQNVFVGTLFGKHGTFALLNGISYIHEIPFNPKDGIRLVSPKGPLIIANTKNPKLFNASFQKIEYTEENFTKCKDVKNDNEV